MKCTGKVIFYWSTNIALTNECFLFSCDITKLRVSTINCNSQPYLKLWLQILQLIQLPSYISIEIYTIMCMYSLMLFVNLMLITKKC